jgi:hypothetical protein
LKAEVFSTDFVAGLTIFLMAIVIFESFYGNLESEIGNYKTRNDAQIMANRVADVLSTSPGYPQNWNSSNVKVIGLYDSGRFSLERFDQLKNINYNVAKTMMGLGFYNIYLEVTNSTGSMIGSYTYGSKEDENASQVFYVRRLGLVYFNGNITKAILNVGVWS